MYPRKLAIAAMALFLTTAGAANADTFTFDWSVAPNLATNYTDGLATTITQQLGSGSPRLANTGNLTLNGSASTLTNFLSVSPNPGGTSCPTCTETLGGYKVDTGTFSVSLYNIQDITAGHTFTLPGTYTYGATFKAKYGGALLSCAAPPSGSDSDCVIWNSNIDNIALTGALTGDVLRIIMPNAEDWTVQTQIQFALVSNNQLTTPIPAALPLFATGLGGLGLLGWRRKRKAAPACAAA
jgi:hypothetical protein